MPVVSRKCGDWMNVMIKHYVRHEDAKPEVLNNGITKRILS